MIQRGIFPVHKPTGLTSAAVVSRIRQLLQSDVEGSDRDERAASSKLPQSQPPRSRARKRPQRRKHKPWLKVGHGGTLDKFAEGVLVIGVGDDCKKLEGFLHDVAKSYSAVGELGRTTDTLDTEGNVTDTKPFEHVQKSDLERAVLKFSGEISQVPPLYSAIKRGGQRLSDMARANKADQQGPPDPPASREITIYSITLTDFTPPHFSISLSCSSGTYVRSLVRDIGLEVGTVAHTIALCRTRQGSLGLADALKEDKWTTEEIRKAIDRVEIALHSQDDASTL